MNKMNELKPCPFCGRSTIYVISYPIIDSFDWSARAKCNSCSAAGEDVQATAKYNVREQYKITHEEAEEKCIIGAIKTWNTRPREDALEAENKQLREALEKIKGISATEPRHIFEAAMKANHIARQALNGDEQLNTRPREDALEAENKLLRNALIRIADSSIPCSDSTDLVATVIFKGIARKVLKGKENDST